MLSCKVFLDSHIGRKTTQNASWIIVDPVLDTKYLLVPKGCDIAAFGNKPPNHAVDVLVRPTLPCAEWMSIVNLCTRAFIPN